MAMSAREHLTLMPARWPRLMSVDIAAEYLSISGAMLTTLQVECVRLGKRRLYDRFVLDRYVDALSGVISDVRELDAPRREQTPDEAYRAWKLKDGAKASRPAD